MRNEKDLRIAFMHRLDLSLHARSSVGFYERLRRSKSFTCTPVLFTCREPDLKIVQAQLAEVVRDDYDIVVTIGSLFSTQAAAYFEKHNFNKPHVFVAVHNPEELGLIDTVAVPGGNTTGVIREYMPPTFAAELLLMVKPTMRSVLVPYYSSGDGGRRDADCVRLKNFLANRGVQTVMLPVSAMTRLDEQVRPYQSRIDTIFFLEGYPFPCEVQRLSRLCNEEQITLFVQDIAALQHGAGVVFGEEVGIFGEKAFDQVKKIIQSGKPTGEIPVAVIPNGRRFLINASCAHLQGVNPDPALDFCLQYGTVIDE